MVTPLKVDQATPGGSQSQPLVVVLLGASLGIVFDRYWPLPVFLWWTVAAVAGIGWLWLCWRRQWFAAAALMVFVAATAGAWHHCRWYLLADDEAGWFANVDPQPVCVQAIALQSPRQQPVLTPDPLRVIPATERSRLEVELVALRDGTRWREVSGRATLWITGTLSWVNVGDRLTIFGQLSTIRGAMNPGQFDFAWHLRAQRQRCQLQAESPACVSLVQSGSFWSLSLLLESIRSQGDRLLREHLAPERSPLAAAILLGSREQVDPELNDAFMETGTVHILSISGLHVGILAGAMLFVLRRTPLPRTWAMLVVAAVTVLYMLLTDAGPPVIRATILVLVVCLSACLGRRRVALNALGGAALVVLILNPAHLFHTGAQLSFLCVAGLMWFAGRISSEAQDPLQRLVEESQGWFARQVRGLGRQIYHLTLLSGLIWLLTLPLVMARFHLLSPVALVLNTLLWLPVTVAMFAGFATLILGMVGAPLGSFCGWVCDMSLGVLEAMVYAFRSLPGSHFWLPGPGDWWLIGFYVGVGLMGAFPRLRPRRRWCVALLGGWMALGLVSARFDRDSGRLRCHVLSMGHGCAAVVQLPNGHTMLYDAGQLGAPRAGANCVAQFLWSQGITHLDAVVLSHADADHYNALPGLLRRFSVGAVYVSPKMFTRRTASLDALQEAIRESGVSLAEIAGGDRFRGGSGCQIEVLHPNRHHLHDTDNADSIVLIIEQLGHRIVLPGDLEPPGLDDVLCCEPRPSDVLLAPHHGSRQSNPPGLCAWCRPRWVIISGTHRWDTRPIERAYAAAGSRVLHTADVGAVCATVDGEGVVVSTFSPRP